MSRSRKNLVITLTFTFILMALLVVFTSRVIFRTAFSSVQELGDDKAVAITADLENYLDTAKSVLWLAADTVDHMVESGATDEEIVEYITRESERTEEQFDESYTGEYPKEPPFTVKDLEEMPRDVMSKLNVVPISAVSDALKYVLCRKQA